MSTSYPARDTSCGSRVQGVSGPHSRRSCEPETRSSCKSPSSGQAVPSQAPCRRREDALHLERDCGLPPVFRCEDGGVTAREPWVELPGRIVGSSLTAAGLAAWVLLKNGHEE